MSQNQAFEQTKLTSLKHQAFEQLNRTLANVNKNTGESGNQIKENKSPTF